MEDPALERRLVALESAVAHQEAQLRDLSDMIAEQWRLIEGLGGRLDRIEAVLGRVLSEGTEDDGDPPLS